MPKILDNGRFCVYVYANDDNPHHLPHCHVYWDGADHASVVGLPDLMVIAATPCHGRRVDFFATMSILLWPRGAD